MADRTPKDVVLDYVAGINRGDSQRLAGLTAAEFTFTDMEGDMYVVRDREAIAKFWDDYFTPYPDYRIYVQNVLVGGDGVAILGQTTGSHLAAEIEAREKVLWIAEVRDGLVAEWRIYSTLGADAS